MAVRESELERARLGARGTIFASRTVNRLFNRLQGEALNITLTAPPRHERDRLVARMRVAGTLDELQVAIRRELGADAISLDAGTATAATAAPDTGPPHPDRKSTRLNSSH